MTSQPKAKSMGSQLESALSPSPALCDLPESRREALHLISTAKGQAAAIESMLREERYCMDVLRQIAAVQGLLSQAAQFVIKGHMQTCLTEAIQTGRGEKKIEELAEVMKYLKGY